MKSKAEHILSELAAFLQESDYALYTELLSSKHHFNDYHYYVDEEVLAGFAKIQKNLIKLFFLGQRLDKETEEESWLPASLYAGLQSMGLITDYGDEFYFGDYYIFPLHGLLLIVDRRAKEKTIQPDTVWLGEDSVFLYKLLPSFQDCKVLDLCTGSGIQAIQAARNGGDVVAVEINPKAAEIAQWNSYLNGKKIRVLQGSLYEPLDPDMKFDYIISNPPYLPTAKQKERFYCADGGDDGLQVLKEILYGAHNYLTHMGKLIIISGCFGTQNKLQVEEAFKTDPQLAKMSFHFFTVYKKNIDTAMDELKLSLPEMAEGININTQDKKRYFSHYYAFICLVKLSSQKRHFTVTDSILTKIRRLKIMRNIY